MLHDLKYTTLFQKTTKVPSKEEMWQEIREKKEAMSQRYKKSLRHTLQVDYIPFMDELAELLGCKPNLSKAHLTTGCNISFLLKYYMYFQSGF